VLWRYDPIIISSLTSYNYHRERFYFLCRALSGSTEQVIVSLVDIYQKTRRRLGALEYCGVECDYDAAQREETALLLRSLAEIATAFGLKICACGEEQNLSPLGIEPARCIDADLIQRLGGTGFHKKDPGQRTYCHCSRSKDIGIHDTCIHDCCYCYATRGEAIAAQRYEEHDPRSPTLWTADRNFEHPAVRIR
jgi:hypothetical protein